MNSVCVFGVLCLFGTSLQAQEAFLLQGAEVEPRFAEVSDKTMGPDGRYYWTAAEAPSPYQLPQQGLILRAEPGIEQPEIFARGLCKPGALMFDRRGHLFVVDQAAGLGDQARLLWVLEGSDFGWREDYRDPSDGYNVWMEENLWKTPFDGQSAAILPCLTNFQEETAGFAYHPGTALSESVEGHFFLSGVGEKKELRAFRIDQDEESARLRVSRSETVYAGKVFPDLSFARDGALYGNGSTFRLDVVGSDPHPMREETASWFGKDWERVPEGRLVSLLGHPDQRLRLIAQGEIVRRGDFTILRQTAVADSRHSARLHGIWGCAELARTRDGESLQSIASLVKHRDPEIRAQILRALGETKSAFALDSVKQALFDSNPQVRLSAALALHHLAGPKDLKDITQYIVANGEEDVFRRHGGVQALLGAARGWPELLVDLKGHDSGEVRLAAVIALRRLHERDVEQKTLKDPEVYAGLADFLKDEREGIVMDAVRTISDVPQSSQRALQAVAEMLESTRSSREAMLRRMIQANRLLGDAASLKRLQRFAESVRGTAALRKEAAQP